MPDGTVLANQLVYGWGYRGLPFPHDAVLRQGASWQLVLDDSVSGGSIHCRGGSLDIDHLCVLKYGNPVPYDLSATDTPSTGFMLPGLTESLGAPSFGEQPDYDVPHPDYFTDNPIPDFCIVSLQGTVGSATPYDGDGCIEIAGQIGCGPGGGITKTVFAETGSYADIYVSSSSLGHVGLYAVRRDGVHPAYEEIDPGNAAADVLFSYDEAAELAFDLVYGGDWHSASFHTVMTVVGYWIFNPGADEPVTGAIEPGLVEQGVFSNGRLDGR